MPRFPKAKRVRQEQLKKIREIRALKKLNKTNEGVAEGSAQASCTEPQPGTSAADVVIHTRNDQNDQSFSCETYKEPEVKVENEEESEVTIVIEDPLTHDTFEGTFRELFAGATPSESRNEEPEAPSEDLDEGMLVMDLPELRAPKSPKPKRVKDSEYYKAELAKCRKKLQEKNAELKSKDGEIAFFRKSLNSVRDTLKMTCKEKQKVRTLLDKRVEELKNAKKTIRDMKKEANEEKAIQELKQQLFIMESKLKTAQKQSMEISEQNMATQHLIIQEITDHNMAGQRIPLETQETNEPNTVASTLMQELNAQETTDHKLAMQIINLIKELAVQTMNAMKNQATQTIFEQELAVQSIKTEPMDRDFTTQIIYLMKDLLKYSISSLKLEGFDDLNESEVVTRVVNIISEEVLVREIIYSLVQELAKATSVMTQRELVW